MRFILFPISALLRRLEAVIEATRPVHPDVERAMAERWSTLPANVKTPAQMLGQRFLGCEGTHGVFPEMQPRMLTVLPLA